MRVHYVLDKSDHWPVCGSVSSSALTAIPEAVTCKHCLRKLAPQPVEPEPFALDLASNPHPKMLAGALDARRRARVSDTNHAAQAYYLGWLHAMAAATGCAEGEIVAWLDRHEAAS